MEQTKRKKYSSKDLRLLNFSSTNELKEAIRMLLRGFLKSRNSHWNFAKIDTSMLDGIIIISKKRTGGINPLSLDPQSISPLRSDSFWSMVLPIKITFDCLIILNFKT
jgi:hypothetical protein